MLVMTDEVVKEYVPVVRLYMHVDVYIYVCIIYVYEYVCMYLWSEPNVCVCMYACMWVCMYVFVQGDLHACDDR
jgi:hypothetical protein